MMKIILTLNRIKDKIERMYRKKLFKAQINCGHNNFNIVGKIITINKNIKLGNNVTIYPNVMFFGDGLIEIGDNVDIGNNTIIYSSKSGGVHIGKDAMIAANCYIIDSDHGTSKNQLIRDQLNSTKKVIIGNDVWLGTHVIVLKGSIINNGAIIGANSLVKGEIEQYSICVGSPACKIKYRK